jgi:hypothetical protein
LFYILCIMIVYNYTIIWLEIVKYFSFVLTLFGGGIPRTCLFSQSCHSMQGQVLKNYFGWYSDVMCCNDYMLLPYSFSLSNGINWLVDTSKPWSRHLAKWRQKWTALKCFQNQTMYQCFNDAAYFSFLSNVPVLIVWFFFKWTREQIVNFPIESLDQCISVNFVIGVLASYSLKRK